MISFHQQLQVILQQSPIDLASAALCLAQPFYPDLDSEFYLNALDTMADEVSERLPAEPYPLRILQTLNRYLYEELGFRGDTDNYYDPRNSFLNQVIERRLGIPITLSLVYLEIAKRIDFPMVGVSFPGHFLIRPDRQDMSIHVDPFYRGEILFEQDCQERLAQIYDRPVTLQPEFFAAVSPQQFLMRLLTNLKHIYLNRGELGDYLQIIEQILLVDPEAMVEVRDRGLAYYQLGQWTAARVDLERYLEACPQAREAPLLQDVINRINRTA